MQQFTAWHILRKMTAVDVTCAGIAEQIRDICTHSLLHISFPLKGRKYRESQCMPVLRQRGTSLLRQFRICIQQESGHLPAVLFNQGKCIHFVEQCLVVHFLQLEHFVQLQIFEYFEFDSLSGYYRILGIFDNQGKYILLVEQQYFVHFDFFEYFEFD